MPLSVNYVEINAQRLDTVCDAYFKWKDLNTQLYKQAGNSVVVERIVASIANALK